MIFVTGLWKSGNNLLQKALRKFGLQELGSGLAASTILGRYRPLRYALRGPLFSKDGLSIGIDVDVVVSRRWVCKSFQAKEASFYTGHAAFSRELLNILSGNGLRIIAIKRDPRDVALSFLEWIIYQEAYYSYPLFASGNRLARLEKLLVGGRAKDVDIRPFGECLDRALEWHHTESVISLRFEDLIGEKGGGHASRQLECLNCIRELAGKDSASVERVREDLFGGSKTFNVGSIGRWKIHFRALRERC